MNTSKITQKGQTTIPAEIRHFMGLSSGSELIFAPLPDGTVLLKTRIDDLDSLKGCLRSKKAATLEDMEKAIRMRAAQANRV